MVHHQNPAKRRRRRVLDEETYLNSLAHIITRDFFPELTDLAAASTTSAPAVLPPCDTPSPVADACSSVDEFHRRYTSGDNAAYAKIARGEETRRLLGRRAREEEEKVRAARERKKEEVEGTGGEGSRRVDTWNYTEKNTLMFVPQRLLVEGETRKGEVCCWNTRFGRRELESDVQSEEDGGNCGGSCAGESFRSEVGAAAPRDDRQVRGFRIREEGEREMIARRLERRRAEKKGIAKGGRSGRAGSLQGLATPVRLSKAARQLAKRYGLTPSTYSRGLSPSLPTPQLTPRWTPVVTSGSGYLRPVPTTRKVARRGRD